MSHSGIMLSAEHLLFMIQKEKKKNLYSFLNFSLCSHSNSEETGLERMQVVICTH